MPTKKSRRQELTVEQHLANQTLHEPRLEIEPVHSSVERCRIVQDRLRLWCQGPIGHLITKGWRTDHLQSLRSGQLRRCRKA